jgi:pimeloyl-ACP methyl ester carboxylesterase
MMRSVLILHGALGSAHQFQRLAEALAPHMHVRILEFVGHGEMPDSAEPWSIDLFATQLEHELERMPVRPTKIIGYSMGGYVAIRLAQRRADLIDRVLTLGTKLDWSVEGAAREIRMLDPDVIQAKVPAFAADLQRRHGTDRWRNILQQTATMMTTLGAAPLLTPENVVNLFIPVHYGIGDRDEMVTLEETIAFYRATPNAQLSVLPGTRHPIEKVETQLFVQTILRWID